MSDNIRKSVLRIYDTVADQSLWPEILDTLVEQIDAKGCIVFGWQGLPTERRLVAPLYSSFFSEKALSFYFDRYGDLEADDQDKFEAHSLKSDSIDLIDDSVLASSLDELKQRKNVAALQEIDILHRAAGLLNKDNTAQSRFSVQLSATRGRLTESERAHLAALLPHIAKALDLGRPMQQLSVENQSLMAAMDRLSVGVCILDANGDLVVSNEEFTRQLDECHVYKLETNGHLKLRSNQNQKRFDTLKQDALSHGKFGARPRKEAISANSKDYLSIEITPLERSVEIGSRRFGGYILYSADTSKPISCDTAPMKRAYGLTDTELSMVDEIGSGLTNAQIADRRNRSVNTINTQVKSILSKSQCTTRAQFVRLMMGFGADYLRP